MTETMMPMKNGCSSVAHMMACPTALAAAPMGAAMSLANPMPARIVTIGVTRMSIFVSLLTALPSSEAKIATNSTASGPPAPPSEFAAKPTGISENSTSGGQLSARPMATAMPGPTMSEHRPPIVYCSTASPCLIVRNAVVRKPMPNCLPIVSRMVPTRSVQNRPCAMAPMASMK